MSIDKNKQKSAAPMGGNKGAHGVVMGGEKAKDFKGTAKRLLQYLNPHKTKLISVIFMAIISTAFTVFSPKLLGETINVILEGMIAKFKGIPGASIDFSKLTHYILLLLFFYVLSAVFMYLQQYIMAGVAQNTVRDMRKDVNEKLNRLPIKYFDANSKGDILSRVTNDVDNISSTLQQSLTQLITAVISMIGITIMMLTISPLLTLICVLTLPICIIATRPIIGKSQKFFATQQKELGQLNGHVEEVYTGHTVIKAFGHEKKAINEFDDINDKLYDSAWKAQFMSGLIMPLMNFINNVGYVIIAVVGGILVTKDKLSVGYIQSFIQYSRQFTQMINQTANIANILQSTMASAERVFEILDEEEEVKDPEHPKTLEAPKGNVNFKNVKFGYTPNELLMKDMNVTAKQGQTIAIVGPTGAGKTTLINLMMRFYELNGGEITFDGVDITDFSRGYLRSMFGMVLQDTWLFNGSIKDNIAYGKEGATFEEVVTAAKAAHADHFIRTLPDGYDTVLNEEASNISQGQKQLLTIARAILANPRVLILDEATSSVDTRTETYIQNAMTRLMEGRTNFVIAHRLSTIKDADLILVMNHGDVIEQGNHEELLEKKGFYADLYNSQFAHEEEATA
ncbi:ABC transporter ATP-binding protein/permease [Clostridium sardiniense]|uniref:ABC transporter ATP-binding protein/permease n=1 Tax=Clostridium sardiniense TaxID=29369 RepID=A0ABS7KUY9_CLOSR|nr:ABC transporter ATP-binding protein/permease [Clostridium sardiniense]MDQ0460767.1 ATP-binding cassette subfamily B protein [Clostridium sardiniense]